MQKNKKTKNGQLWNFSLNTEKNGGNTILQGKIVILWFTLEKYSYLWDFFFKNLLKKKRKNCKKKYFTVFVFYSVHKLYKVQLRNRGIELMILHELFKWKAKTTKKTIKKTITLESC